MIGPSSSHTAGVVRIGLIAHHILGAVPTSVTITFYNSFATTFEGHGSDRAVIAGLMGMATDDDRIKTSLSIAEETGLTYTFRPVGNASTLHPNSIKIQAKTADKEVEVLGESLGGGVIRITEVNGFPCNFSGSTDTIIILADDVKGTIAFLADILSNDDCNIATMSVSRKGKNDLACQFMEIDSAPRPITIEFMRSLKWVHTLTYLNKIR
jgi:L-serine dehydratase